MWRRFSLLAVIAFALVLLWSYGVQAVPSVTQQYQQAIASWHQGQARKAVALWQQILKQTTDPDLRSRTLLNLTQAYLELGEARRARSAWEEGKSLANAELAPLVAGIEGNLALAEGDWSGAIAAYQNAPPDSLTALNNLSIAYERRSEQRQQQSIEVRWEGDETDALKWERLAAEDREQAQNLARSAIELAGRETSLAAARSWLRWGKLGHQQGWKRAVEILTSLPEEKAKVLLLVEAVRHDPQLFSLAEATAKRLKEPSLLGKVWQAQGEYWQERGDATTALALFQKAYQSYLYREGGRPWSILWNLGRSYQSLAQEERAIKYYRQALDAAEKQRADLASAPRAVQLAFQSETAPLYRELLGLLLAEPGPSELTEAIKVLQMFQLAELESFFADPCQLSVAASSAAPQEASIYTVVLPSALHEIVRFPGEEYRHRAVELTSGEVEAKVRQWRGELEDQSDYEFLHRAAQLYDWLLRPWQEELERRGIESLTFINDSVLRTVPMAALWDGQQYLIESYRVSYSLGLDVAVPQPTGKISPVIFGTTQGSEWFPEPLPFVSQEVRVIQQLVGGSAFLDRQFTRERLSRALAEGDYTVLHLASHARFASFEGSFVQTGGEPLSLGELERALRSRSAPLQLLALSACQTAAGNDRAILGLAGVGVRSGIPSVLGSLWFAADRTTAELVESFYRHWQTLGKPELALRQAQLELVASPLEHPRYWATYILVKN